MKHSNYLLFLIISLFFSCEQETIQLKEIGIRAKSDLRNEKIGFKIREHTLRRVPYLLVVGDKEIEAGEIAVRSRKGDDLGKMSVDAFIELACEQIKSKQIQ